jgi:hypothetical protein
VPPDVLAAHHDRPVAELRDAEAPAQRAVALDQFDVVSRTLEPKRRGQAGDTATNDRDPSALGGLAS